MPIILPECNRRIEEIEPYAQFGNGTLKLYYGDAVQILKGIEGKSVHCVVTSPPYFGLRKYINEFGEERNDLEYGYEMNARCQYFGMKDRCNKCHLCHLTNTFEAIKRVLRDDGSVFIVYGNMYYQTIKGNTTVGHKQVANDYDESELLTITYDIIEGLRRVGYQLRQEIVWYKPNGMPDSTLNRCTKKTERILHFVLNKDYYFDMYGTTIKYMFNGETKEKRRDDVWEIPHKKDWKPFDKRKQKHTAIFPERLVEECIKGTYAPYSTKPYRSGSCASCGKPYVRIYERKGAVTLDNPESRDHSRPYNRNAMSGSTLDGEIPVVNTLGWRKNCLCKTNDVIPCLILDPFMGSGTTFAVALKHKLRCYGIDVYKKYIDDFQIPRIQFVRRDPHVERFLNRHLIK